MNVDDVIGAMEDLVEAHGAVPTDKIHVRSINGGSESIDGFDIAEGSVYVLGGDGKPTVSMRVVRELEAEIERLYDSIALSVDIMERYGFYSELSPAYEILRKEADRV